MRLTVGEIARDAGGEVLAGSPAAVVESFSHDSRRLGPRACFVAVQGARDGHDFAADAVARGAVALLVARVPPGLPGDGIALVRVDDPLAALGRLAAAARARRRDLEVVGLTGSTGKTSTKDLAAAALGRVREVHASPESFNNELGLPLTVLGTDASTEVLVVEMGARFPGNIEHLCRIAVPTVGVVTNVGLAHAEHLGGPEGVARVKGELLAALPAGGLAVVDLEAAGRVPPTPARLVTVGGNARADVVVRDVELDGELRPRVRLATPWGDLDVRLGVRGAHQAHNAALAATVALALGVEPEEVAAGLRAAGSAPGRMHLRRRPDGAVVLDDSYNANPDSTAAALRSLAALDAPGRRIAVLGPMLELGERSPGAHARLGRLAARLGLDVLVVVGAEGEWIARGASGVEVVRAHDADDAAARVALLVRGGDAVLVKASRAVGLDRVADALAPGEEAAR